MGCGASAEVVARLNTQQEQLEQLNTVLASLQNVTIADATTRGPESACTLQNEDGRGTSSIAILPIHPEFGEESLVCLNDEATQAQKKAYKYDVFVSHAKKLSESEDRAVWVADVIEISGMVAFFDRSDLIEITEAALKQAMTDTKVCVTVLDPFSFQSPWVLGENQLAANLGIPIVMVYDSDRFRWEGQLDKWCKVYPWAFKRQVVPLTNTQRRKSVQAMLAAITAAGKEEHQPPAEKIQAAASEKVMAKIGVGGSRETDTRGAVDSAHAGMLARLGGSQPSFIICGFTCTHDSLQVAKRLHELSPAVPMIGCTSCRGLVLNDTWLTHKKEFALGMWGICDDTGMYTTCHIQDRPEDLRSHVAAEVGKACGTKQSTPSFAILLGSPGDEEIILSGMQDALGESVPIIGGSSADNTVAGEWKQIAKVGSAGFTVAEATVSSNGIAIVVAWASCETATTLTSGFNKTQHTGKVTKVDESDHGRTILEIDGKDVKTVYEGWSQGEITKGVSFDEKGNATILASSSFCPLGEPGSDGDIRVMHPAFLNANSGALTTFADARVGMDIVMLNAAPETMAKSISQSARSLIVHQSDVAGDGKDATISEDEIMGAFSIFCGGLVMAIDDQMPMAAEQLAGVLGHNNTMAICCFGEQGMNLAGNPTHGNLMFGCLLFSNKLRKNETDEPLIVTKSLLN